MSNKGVVRTLQTENPKYLINQFPLKPQALPPPSLESLKKKLKFYEQDLIQVRQHNKDIEMSLTINKQMIDVLLKSSNLSEDVVKVFDQLKVDNLNLYNSLKVSYEDRQKASTQILILEQIYDEHKEKEKDNQKLFLEQILNMKEQMEKKNFLIEIKNRYFSDLLVLAKQNISSQDRSAMNKLQELLKNKTNAETNASGQMNIQSIISEKERLSNELENAMGQIDKLRTLLAENTLNTLFTVPDNDHSMIVMSGCAVKQNDKFQFKDVVEGAGNANDQVDPRMSKSFTTSNNIGGFGKGLKKVPGLDFSNLKQNKDFKDWYSYAKKLEDAIKLLREKISMMEKENVDQEFKYQKLSSQFDLMTNMNVELGEKLSYYKKKIQNMQLQQCKNCGANGQHNLSDVSQDGCGQKYKSAGASDDWSGKRVSKRNKSQVTFVKKNLTLEIEKINKEMERKQQQMQQQMESEDTLSNNMGNTTFNKKAISDSQEDSPIRE